MDVWKLHWTWVIGMRIICVVCSGVPLVIVVAELQRAVLESRRVFVSQTRLNEWMRRVGKGDRIQY